MEKERNKDELIKTYRIAFVIIMIIAISGVLILGVQSSYYKLLYKEAIKQGAENTLNALKMVTACSTLGNYTMEEIQMKTLEMYVYKKLNETSEGSS